MLRTYKISQVAKDWKRNTWHPDHAKILILDIETAPVLAYVWRLFKENVGLDQIQGDWCILSFAAKWLGDNKVYYYDQAKVADIHDERVLLLALHAMLDEADIVVAHNGRRFDLKKINARFLKAGMSPPSPYQIVDTLEIAKGAFAFTSNKLAYLTDHLNKDFKKLDHGQYPGFKLWAAVLAGDKKAWAEMRKYNEYDVLSLEETYLLLRPWDKRHPNVAVGSSGEDPVCPTCGGTRLYRRGFQNTNTGQYRRYSCGSCGSWSRSRYTLNSIGKRKSLLAKV